MKIIGLLLFTCSAFNICISCGSPSKDEGFRRGTVMTKIGFISKKKSLRWFNFCLDRFDFRDRFVSRPDRLFDPGVLHIVHVLTVSVRLQMVSILTAKAAKGNEGG